MRNRKRLFVSFAGALISVLLISMIPGVNVREGITQDPDEEDVVILRSGTFIAIRLNATASSDGKVGSDIPASVIRDVEVGGRVVIRARTPARVTLGSAKKSGMIGKGGKIELTLHETKTVDGQSVLLRGSAGSEGEEKLGSTVVLSALLCPLFLLREGEVAQVKAGAEIRGYVGHDIRVKFPKLK